jgi:L-alanine-DL-glutamate epimerase-like enolase superfamily enzyme
VIPVRRVAAEVVRVAPRSAAEGYAGQEGLSFVRVSVEAGDGLVGTGVTGRFLAPQVAALLNGGIAEEIAGQDALATEATLPRLARRFNPRGETGVFVSAASALDIALWDLKGQALGLPVARLIGGARDAVPCYATVGFPAYGEAELIAACQAALAEGHRGVKMLVAAAGRPVHEDAARVRAVRAAIGPGPLLMLDANCGFALPEAKRLCALVADCDVYWFEEPLRGNDLVALAELRRSTAIPLASGQMIQSVAWFREAIRLGALDWLQPNAAFCGGIGTMLRILALAEAAGLPVATAGGWEIANLPVMAGHAHGGMLEVHGAHAGLRELLDGHPPLAEGALAAPARPGIGFAFRA